MVPALLGGVVSIDLRKIAQERRRIFTICVHVALSEVVIEDPIAFGQRLERR